MQGSSKWLFPVLISLWLIGCSHAPAPSPQVAQQPAQTSAAQAATQGVPKAEVPEKEFNFGAMTEDGTYVHDFRILNTGTGILEIKEVMAA